MSRTYNYLRFDDTSGPDITTSTHTITSEEILAEYWEHWVLLMRRVGRVWLINEENCIEDWVISNWAQLVDK